MGTFNWAEYVECLPTYFFLQMAEGGLHNIFLSSTQEERLNMSDDMDTLTPEMVGKIER